uniref:NADH-ubiquinone oxidoreductase chain 4 n=1 Tax=Amyrsidea minuta TaxID=2364307 RepID=A0A386B2K2_9NEOP|nr:NADH dehydrogenase subunit 4 [Amyrsidea minuta]
MKLILSILFSSLTTTTSSVEMFLLSFILNISYLYFPWKGSWLTEGSFIVFDKISSILLFLTIWISLMMLLTADNYQNSTMLKILTNILMITLIFLFLTPKVVTFFILYEFSLIPTMMIILGWGYQPERIQAAFSLLLYTMIFSLPFLSVILFYKDFMKEISFPLSGSDISYFSNSVTLICCLIFLVKIPLFFIHFWLPKAHVEAPLPGSMILAGVLLKMGGYGLIRFNQWMTSNTINNFFVSLAAVGMILICLVCLSTTDMKMIIAYSSINHMNFMIVGLMMTSLLSLSGSLIMMISHGLVSSGMFFLADTSYKRFNSRSLFNQKSFIILQPLMGLWWFILSMLNIGLPPTMGSISEIYIIISTVKDFSFFQSIIVMYMFFSAFYSIFLFYNVNHGILKEFNGFFPLEVKEHMLLMMHILPAIIITFYTCTLVL